MSRYNWKRATIPYASPDCPSDFDREKDWEEWCADEDAKGDEERFYDE